MVSSLVNSNRFAVDELEVEVMLMHFATGRLVFLEPKGVER